MLFPCLLGGFILGGLLVFVVLNLLWNNDDCYDISDIRRLNQEISNLKETNLGLHQNVNCLKNKETNLGKEASINKNALVAVFYGALEVLGEDAMSIIMEEAHRQWLSKGSNDCSGGKTWRDRNGAS